MFADAIHAAPLPEGGRLAPLARRIARAFHPAGPDHLPAELRRLSDHLLHDIGIDPRLRPPRELPLVTPPDLLLSQEALAALLASMKR